MRVSFKWLKELVDIPAESSPRDVAERLTLVGLEVEGVHDLAAQLKGVIVGNIVTREKHPQADNLSVCSVDVGEPEPLQIVCGAPNCDAGKLVAVARIGVTLPGDLTIAERELRGVKSFGMLCSGKELALPGGDHAGILVLEGTPAPAPGTPLARAIGLDDTVLEVSVTPNRPDALSHVGIARDVAASLSVPLQAVHTPTVANPTPFAMAAVGAEAAETARRTAVTSSAPSFRVKMPPATCAERGGPVDDAAQVKVDDLTRCPRYAARIIEGITVGPSPQWLQRRVEACGMRAINNIVDVTNLVMLERGHPLHAFDVDRLGLDRGRPTVVVRVAKPGEKLVTLDGVERQLHAEDLLICDPERPIALAGVMGGRESEVQRNTTRVLLEAAYFQPSSIRRTARRHGLHTEASHRFERGTDPNRTLEEALNRATQLIAELGGGQVRRGIVQAYPKPIEPIEVTLRPARAAMLLGLPQKLVDEALVARILTSLGLEVSGRDAGALRFRIPTYRPDLTLEVDLVEEVGRMLGLDRIPEVLPRGSGRLPPRVTDRLVDVQDRTRQAMTGAGFDEAVNFGFLSPKELAPFDDDGQRIARLQLRNPLSEEVSVMRTSLLPALVRNVLHNQRRGEQDIRLFELGTAFLGPRAEGDKPRPQTDDGPVGGDAFALERTHLAMAMAGQRGPQPAVWAPKGQGDEGPELDFYDLKGVIEELLEALGFDPNAWHGNIHLEPPPLPYAPYLHPGVSALVKHGDATLGVMGALHPALLEKLELRAPVLLAEMNLTAVAERLPTTVTYRHVPRFPAVRRDLAALVDEPITIEQVLGAVRLASAAKEGLVEDVALFDLFRGEKLPPGKKSVGISLLFRAADRTLTDEQVNALHQEVMNAVERELKAEVRKG